MTDRNEFAAAALTGLLARFEGWYNPDAKKIAESAFAYADAMLEEAAETAPADALNLQVTTP